MKKLMFACTCAAFAAAFADPFNATGFESLNVGQTGISVKGDDGSDSSAHYFCFLGDEGVVDGSMVKAYGGEDSLPAFTYRAACGVPNFFATAGLTQAKYLGNPYGACGVRRRTTATRVRSEKVIASSTRMS